MSNCSSGAEAHLVLAVTKGDAVYQGIDQLCIFWCDDKAECILCLLQVFQKICFMVEDYIGVELTCRPRQHASISYFLCKNTPKVFLSIHLSFASAHRSSEKWTLCLPFWNFCTNKLPVHPHPKKKKSNWIQRVCLEQLLIYLHGDVRLWSHSAPETHFKSFFLGHTWY